MARENKPDQENQQGDNRQSNPQQSGRGQQSQSNQGQGKQGQSDQGRGQPKQGDQNRDVGGMRGAEGRRDQQSGQSPKRPLDDDEDLPGINNPSGERKPNDPNKQQR